MAAREGKRGNVPKWNRNLLLNVDLQEIPMVKPVSAKDFPIGLVQVPGAVVRPCVFNELELRGRIVSGRSRAEVQVG